MNEDKPGIGQFLGYLKEKRSLWLIAAALIIGILLMVFGGDGGSVGASSEQAVDVEALEERVASLCRHAAGVSDVTVMITLDTLGEQLYAQNVELDEGGERREYVSVSQGLIPTVERAPRIRGIAVVLTGGDDAAIRLKLTDILCALFDIPSSAVSIAGGR